ncbi:chromosomal replication initiator protein DnaA [Candidatus Saccharibacteria bacterium CG_4_10_14_0_2_um_filter_52_9]|nr:MAG: chromosomal replication initiator protein DnaA [Candidatus Saccharibacteria bacterium CG_4_10_14_0_2_um_filter_52_9]
MQQDKVWQAILGEIEVTLTRAIFHTYFSNTSLVKQADGLVVVGVGNIFIKNHIEKNYGDLIIKTLQKQGVKVDRVEYTTVVVPQKREQPKSAPDGQLSAVPATQTMPAGGLVSTGSNNLRQGLNDRYTLDNFVVGDGNDVAFAACQAVTQHPGAKYNPLYLYGGVGIGKTHLIQAVGNALQARNPQAKVLYIATEQFVREFVQALRGRTAATFANKYRSADVLIVDDVQFLANKDKIQEEFFHTFNTLHQANKQIIMSSDKQPRDIAGLEDRLRSRFSGGMSIDMQVPDFETRCAIIQTKAEVHQSELDPEVVEYLATNGQVNIRELEGALNQLLAWCDVRGLVPTVAIAASLLQVNKSRPKHLSAKQIIERTARHFRIPMEDIVGSKRDKDIVVPRQVAMYMLHEELRLSYPKIARELGRKDHTTAMHSVRKIARESQIDSSLRSAITEIKEHLYV